MKLGEIITHLITELSQKQQEEKPNHFVQYKLNINIDPKYKAFCIFLLNITNRRLGSPYNDICANVGNGIFHYDFDGDKNEIVLNMNSFYKHGGNLKTYFSKLIPAFNETIKLITEGWIKKDKSVYGDQYINMENSNINGTFYKFLLEQIALNMGITDLIVSPWKTTDGFSIDDRIRLNGKNDSVSRFLESIASELSISRLKSQKTNALTPTALINYKATENSVEITVSNGIFHGDVEIVCFQPGTKQGFFREKIKRDDDASLPTARISASLSNSK